MRLVVAVQTNSFQVAPVQSALPAAVCLDRVDVMNLDSNHTAILTPISCLLHLRLR